MKRTDAAPLRAAVEILRGNMERATDALSQAVRAGRSVREIAAAASDVQVKTAAWADVSGQIGDVDGTSLADAGRGGLMLSSLAKNELSLEQIQALGPAGVAALRMQARAQVDAENERGEIPLALSSPPWLAKVADGTLFEKTSPEGHEALARILFPREPKPAPEVQPRETSRGSLAAVAAGTAPDYTACTNERQARAAKKAFESGQR